MSKTVFRFKQFSVSQKQAAMKIGTDGVLLGAWTDAQKAIRVLDIGTGTGLISLMLAQRFPFAHIVGIEINENAANEAKFNFDQSPFQDRLDLVHSSIQEFRTDDKFDLITSNPPFFQHTHLENSPRNLARQQSDLTFEELIFHTDRLLSPQGEASFVIPFENERNFLQIAEKYHLYPHRITRVKGHANAEFKRSLLQLGRENISFEPEDLTIEIERNVYTPEYINLTKDFYLKM